MNRLIAIDFDDTITKHSPYPIMGELNQEAASYIVKLHKAGYTLALWTCRSGKYLDEAVQLLKDNNLYDCFTFINDDLYHNNDHRKIIASFYIDDRSTLGEINWQQVYSYILKTFPIGDEQ